MVVTLIGYRATGKSTVGELLAERLGWNFVDIDQQIESSAGKTIAAIFSEHGEPHFRHLEREHLRTELDRHQQVISSGGGAILDPETRKQMKQCGPVIWLTADVESIIQRLQSDHTSSASRPSLTGAGLIEEVESVLRIRRPLYEETATLTISTEDRSPEDIVETILFSLNDELGGPR